MLSCQAGVGRQNEVLVAAEVVHHIRYEEEEEKEDTMQLQASGNDTDRLQGTDSPSKTKPVACTGTTKTFGQRIALRK